MPFRESSFKSTPSEKVDVDQTINDISTDKLDKCCVADS